jgi:hypothetical protein
MKKWSFLVVGILFILSFFVGCKGKTSPTAPEKKRYVMTLVEISDIWLNAYEDWIWGRPVAKEEIGDTLYFNVVLKEEVSDSVYEDSVYVVAMYEKNGQDYDIFDEYLRWEGHSIEKWWQITECDTVGIGVANLISNESSYVAVKVVIKYIYWR